ncbi:MAG: hypothetical protein VKL42_08890 [Snowella sp.]|nr:hypothetical protein [Snowella sp.]
MNIEEIAKELSTLTGKEWEKLSHDDRHYGSHGEIGLKGSQAKLYLNENEREKKIKISGCFQILMSYGWENLSHNAVDSINAAVTKSPAQVAKDINRRLLPYYLPEFERAVEVQNRWEVQRLEKLETIKLLAEIAGLEPKLEPHTDRIYGYRKVKEIGVFSEIDLKLSVTKEEAAKILQLIA